MIKPEGIPIAELTKVIQTIDAHDQVLRDIGPKFTLLGQDVNRTFKGLAPHYEAPERDLLIGSTQIIENKLGEFGPTLPTMAGHLRNLAGATQEKLTQLTNIRTEAYDWHRRKNGNPEWQNDQDMIDDNNRMVKDVTKIMQEELPAICFTAANAIAQLYGGRPWDVKTGVREGDQPPPPPDEDKEQEPPAWGTEEERDKPWWQDCLEFPVNAVVGVLTVVGETVQSILTLIPVLPALGSIGPLRDFMHDKLHWDMPTWQQAGDSWKGLGMMVAQVVTAPYQLAWAAFDSVTGLDTRPDAVKEFGEKGLTMGKEMLKGFVAWDEWSKNPGKAFGMALTNVVATVASGGSAGAVKTAAMAGKFGAASMTVAKVAGVAEKLQVTRGALHDAALGAVTKIPKVADVVNGMSKIPIVGETFKMQNLTKVDVPKLDAPNVETHTPANTPHGSVDTPSVHTTSVDAPSVHAPSVESPSVHTPNLDAPSAHTGGADPAPVSHAGTNTPTAHSNPSTPVSHTDPGTPTSHTDPGMPASHTDPGTAASSPHTPAHTPAATPNTPSGTHAPDPATHTPAATHTPEPATHTPE
ncbi:MAG TPA: hypothetical protein VFH76_05240, partial [Kribbella sp.]|nr:hypothetical protein [Kribbella sp.]